MTNDYNAKLAQDYENIRDRVERGMLPLVARIPAIDKAVSDYVLARDEHLESQPNPPIAFRDAGALDSYADLILYEELKWSHPDKMAIVEYPLMSDDQLYRRHGDESPQEEMKYGDRTANARKKTYYTDDDGTPQVRNSKMPEPYNDDFNAIVSRTDLREAIDKARLTDRQKQALWLVYGEDMSQEQAAKVMGTSDRGLRYHISAGLSKIRRNFDESTS